MDRLNLDIPNMTDQELDEAIRSAHPQRNFSRLSVQLLELSQERVDALITEGLQGFQEHVPEPEPNPQRFIGHIRYNKDGYVEAYERLKPMRDLSRMLHTFLPNMRTIRDGIQTRYLQMLAERERRQLQARLANQNAVNEAEVLREIQVPPLENLQIHDPPVPDLDPHDDDREPGCEY